MTNILNQICQYKRCYVESVKLTKPLSEIKQLAEFSPDTRGFAEALRKAKNHTGCGLIAEIKKSSPSRGLIRKNFDPVAIAKAYQSGGAACLSVLTDKKYFQGRDEYLTAVKGITSLPVLRKDFILDTYQVYEARAIGADCILLIMAILEDAEAEDFSSLASELSMDVLVEVHNETELERALLIESALIGINNRNLKSLEIDLETTERLAPKLPLNRLGISESGLSSHRDLERMGDVGVHCFLIGEALMGRADIEIATRQIIGATLPLTI